MTTTRSRPVGVVTARVVADELVATLGLPPVPEARPGADLWIRRVQGLPTPEPAPVLRAADGWVHPGPPTLWPTFVDMVTALGAPPVRPGRRFPDLSSLAAETIDAEAGAWLLPAVAVRTLAAAAPAVPVPPAPIALRDATVVVLGTAWATPLIGLLLAHLGARVQRVEHPGRPDPFPLHDRLLHGQTSVALDLNRARDRDRFGSLLESADLLVDGHPPRVLANAGLPDDRLARDQPALALLRVAAFAEGDRPGYGPAAECRGGWAARHDPPRLGRSSVADPVAGLLGALAAADLLDRPPGARGRVSLEGAVGHLLARETARG
jgi:CoA-transferase family III